jgi:hypothetical protein
MTPTRFGVNEHIEHIDRGVCVLFVVRKEEEEEEENRETRRFYQTMSCVI